MFNSYCLYLRILTLLCTWLMNTPIIVYEMLVVCQIVQNIHRGEILRFV